MIAIERVTKRFADRVVLDDLTLHFERGQTLAICGPSGCGKSTLLRCIVGLERFDAGAVRVGDVALGPRTKGAAERLQEEAAAKIRLRVGLVLQHYGLFSHMTVLENVVEAPLRVLGMDPREARERASELLETVGVMHRRDAYPREMSGGEQQRVAIARALAMSPEALLLDEPTSALDAERKAAVVALLERVAVGGTTLILVTHEPLVVRELARRAILLRGGKVAADGTPGDVVKA